MHQQIIIEIGKKVRKIRKEKGLTVQVVAERAGVSKGLISRIENSKTIPSLPVLISIIKSLEVPIPTFFEDIDAAQKNLVILKKAHELSPNPVEDNLGQLSFSILQKKLPEGVFHTSVIILEPNFSKQNTTLEGYVLKYILEGKLVFEIHDERIILEKGDSLFFDARRPHSCKNIGITKARFLEILYLV